MNTTKTNIFIPIAILLIIFSILTINIVNIKYQKNKELHTFANKIDTLTIISKLLHELQIERGLSSGYIASKGMIFGKKVKIQREQTKKEIAKFRKILNDKSFNSAQNIKELLSQIEKIENDIEKLNISSDKVIKYYSSLNAVLIQSIFDVAKQATLIQVRKQIMYYFNFLKLKEYVGIQRAVGTVILLQDKTNLKLKLQYHEAIIKYAMYRESFIKISKEKMLRYYKSNLDNTLEQKIEFFNETILNSTKNSVLNININDWFDIMSKKINLLKDTEDYFTNDMSNSIELKLSEHTTNMIIFAILNIISIFVFIFMIMKIINILKNESRLKEMIDKYIILSTTDLKGNIISASSAFSEISGYTKDELIGKPHNIIRHPDMKSAVFKQMWKTIESGKKYTGNVKNLRKDGSYYWVNANIEPIFNSKGKIESYIAIRHDITDKKIIEALNNSLEERIQLEVEKSRLKDQQMIEQSRLAQMGEMLSMIAHQWRQPLSAISAIGVSLELKAKLNKLDNDLAIQQANNIYKYSQHLSLTINDFRDFFKPVKDKQDISLDEAIGSALNIIETSIVNRNISIVKKLNSKKYFKIYSNELKQVILNLLKNAEDILIEKNIEDPVITIVTTDNSLSIKDNGGGVPEDIIDKIFDPYFSTKTEKNGTGLGLYMSKVIIEEHCGGKLSVVNDEYGAVFTIELKQNEQSC